MRPGAHGLDVHEVVETIEKMYNNLKADIELNTPDSYTSVTNQRRVGEEKETRIGGIDTSKLETLASGPKGVENGKLHGLASGGMKSILHQEEQIKDKVERFKADVLKDVRSHEAEERDARTRAAINEGKQAARDGVENAKGNLERTAEGHKREPDDAVGGQRARALGIIGGTGRVTEEGIDRTPSPAMRPFSDLVEEISKIHQTAASGGRAAAARQIQRLAQRLAGRDEEHEKQRREGEKSGES